MTEQEIQKLAADYAALLSEYAALKEEIALMQQQNDWMKKQLFGRKTEQTSVIMEGGTQLSMFSDENEKKPEPSEEVVTVAEHKRKKKRTHDDWMSHLPVQEVTHEEEHPVCEKCGSIRRAEYPKPMIPGSFCSPELLAHIIYEKYAKAVPLYRQESDLASKHIYLLRATMSNWVDVAAKNWFIPIVDSMHELMLMGDVIHADESRLQVLHEDGRKPTSKSQMWVYCNGKMNDRSIIVFEYQPTRGGKHPKNFFRDYTGYMVCDGLDSYNAVEGAKRCGCWTHTRRKFVECLPKDKSLHKTSVAAKAVDFCNKIYHEENLLKEMTAEERYNQRLVKVKPLLDAFFAWLETVPVTGNSKLAQAVNYALNERNYLYTFLENGNVPIDNNRAENAIRPFAVGRKNWLFSNTANGAKASAAIYSVISTARANGLDAEAYLTELFSKPTGTLFMPWRVENK